VGEELSACVKCRHDWPIEEQLKALEWCNRRVMRWGREWSATSMLVARRNRRHYADSGHGGGIAEFEQMTDQQLQYHIY
jgi:hypothetical protein